MRFTYYPGCSAHASAKEYDMSARAVCEKLGVELIEIDDWNCCGALEAENPLVSVALSVRNLAIAEESGLDLAIPCSACYFNAAKAVKYLREDESVQKKLLDVDHSLRFNDTIAPRHLLDVIVNEVGVEEIRRNTTRPLSGIKVVPYYGCLIGRPSDIAFDDPDNPRSMDLLIEAVGAEQPSFSHKAKCCGGALIMTNFDYSMEMSRKILEDAKGAGADCIIVGCPVCHLMLDGRQSDIEAKYKIELKIPVLYFTQLLGLAFGIEPGKLGLNKNIVSTNNLVSMIKGA
ncbi:CoB--CoM heterodisulfide reductase subunit B [Candidatus Methanoperedenaceae archaeon GB50]|nr:MAG: CoB--CoM heterodisulfide reductase subunit B [Candidatus Methanoperedenaceae archaeon GB50]CAD7772376.1 CoB--CoM heterodisulfide reductase subunit B [Candidatus Methanoperedenaceae archaeon GB50]